MVNLSNKLKIFVTIFWFITFCFAQHEDSVNAAMPLEARTVTIKAQVKTVDVSPTAYRISYYPRTRQAEPFITKLFFMMY